MRRRVIYGPTPEAQVRIHFVRYVCLEEWKLDQMAAPFWRCYCPLESGGSVVYNGRTFPLRPANVMLIPPHTPCASFNTRPFRKFYGHFSCLVARLRAEPGVYVAPLPGSEWEAVRSLRETAGAGPGLELQLTFLILRAISYALGALPEGVLTSARTCDSAIEKTVLLMQESCDEPFSNSALAERSGMHVNSFVRLFTRQIGTPPQRYYRRLRLEQACRLLIETSDSIDQVAGACGFWDRNHFTRAFAQQWHCPPAEWRRRNR